MLGKPIVATVPPRCAVRLAATGNGSELALRFQQSQIIGRIHLHHFGAINPALVTKRTCAASLTT